MNANQQYRLDQLHREDVMRQARRQQLIQKALDNRPKTRRAYVTLMTLLQSLFR